MTFSLTPILVGILFAAPGSLTEITVVTGGRTAPESALEFVFEAENELEPSGLGAVLADTGITWNNGTWIGASAEAWGYTPESEASVFKLGLRAGQGRSLPAGWLAIVAGRYDIEAVPWIEEASSGRAEALAMIRKAPAPHGLELSFKFLDRIYPFYKPLGFRTSELTGLWRLEPSGARHWLSVGGSWQGNQGWVASADDGLKPVFGWQGRLLTSAGWTSTHWALSAEYRLYYAERGDIEEEERSQFTLVGDYADDADALSSGGFVQHRINLALAWTGGPWTITSTALGRRRSARLGEHSTDFHRTLHAELELRRALSGPWEGFATLGVSAVTMTDGRGYTDTYGWIGVSRRIQGPRAGADGE